MVGKVVKQHGNVLAHTVYMVFDPLFPQFASEKYAAYTIRCAVQFYIEWYFTHIFPIQTRRVVRQSVMLAHRGAVTLCTPKTHFLLQLALDAMKIHNLIIIRCAFTRRVEWYITHDPVKRGGETACGKLDCDTDRLNFDASQLENQASPWPPRYTKISFSLRALKWTPTRPPWRHCI